MSQGRAGQRARTRAAIVDAARGLMRTDVWPSVEQAADAAGVSRATAYRYFPTQEALEVELESVALWSPLEAALAADTSRDPEARLLNLIDQVGLAVDGRERHVRTALRVYQDTWLRQSGAVPQAVRRGRRREWIARALEPLPPMAPDQYGRLVEALALVVGPDPVIMLNDVAGLDRAEATAVLRWAARALLRAAVEEAGARPPPDDADPGSAETPATGSRRRG